MSPVQWVGCVHPKYLKYVIAFIPLTYLSAYFQFLVHFVASSHLKYVWITYSKCRSAIQLEQLEEFACDTYFTCILNVWIRKWFSHILTTHFAFVGKLIVKYLVGFIVLTYSSMNFEFVIWFLPVTYLITNLTNVEEYVKGLQATNMDLCLRCHSQTETTVN